MAVARILIDTNVFIGLEDPRKVDPVAAEFVQLCSAHDVAIFVHEASRQDIARDKNFQRREISESKLEKFQHLKQQRLPVQATLEAEFGTIRKPNDRVDVVLLHALSIGLVDLLVTEDKGIHDRVLLSRLAAQVLTVADALIWLRRTYEPTKVRLPFVEEQKAHEIDQSDPLFDSLRDGYPNFDAWWTKCVKQHRDCWTVTIGDVLAGIVVRKPEARDEAPVKSSGDRILKLCTFKVRSEFRGEKLGELLLKQALWYAQRNNYDIVYLTTYETQTTLMRVLEYFGFEQTHALADGELVFEKTITQQPLRRIAGVDVFLLDRRSYPRFVLDEDTRIFAVPIQWEYHEKLFPEIAVGTPLPLLPAAHPLLNSSQDRTPGNSIRKVYLCRAPTRSMRPGDILAFYQSKAEGRIGSQAITSIGVVERVDSVSDPDELLRRTAKRSVFSDVELRQMASEKTSPVLVIDFLLIGHLDVPIPLNALIRERVFRGPPQSILQIPLQRFQPVRSHFKFGFEV